MFGIWFFSFVARWVEMCRTKDEEEDDFACDASVLFKTIIDVCETVNRFIHHLSQASVWLVLMEKQKVDVHDDLILLPLVFPSNPS